MKNLMNKLLAPVAAAAILLGTSDRARAGHLDPPSIKVKFAFGGGQCGGGAGGGSFWHGPGIFRKHAHRHAPRLVYEQVWFAPVYENRVVGYSSCGKPIYKSVIVKCGHYKTAVYKTCGCGDKDFQYYL